jgi:hypothetical protein
MYMHNYADDRRAYGPVLTGIATQLDNQPTSQSAF